MPEGQAGGETETLPIIAVQAKNTFLPVSFQTRSVIRALNDTDYMRGRLAEKADSIVPKMARFEGIDWDRIMLYITLLAGKPLDIDDFNNMGLFFRNAGTICDDIIPHECDGFNADFYEPWEEAVVSAHDPHFDEERGKLGEGNPNKDELRGRILELFDASYLKVKKALTKALEADLGVRFDIDEQNGIYTARQRVPKYPDPIYALRETGPYRSTAAQVRVQRYTCCIENSAGVMRMLRGGPATAAAPDAK